MGKLCILLIALCFSVTVKADTLHVYFPVDEAFLDANIQKKVDKIIDKIQGRSNLLLIGYADDRGDQYYNDMLSMRRAQSISNYLQTKGIAADKIKLTLGKGEISRWENEQDKRKEDRRVDVIFKSVKVNIPEPVKELPKPKPAPVVEKPVDIKDVKVGSTLTLENIQFLPGMAIVTQESKPVLDDLYQEMKDNDKLEIQIEGHICCIPGSDSAGMRLSVSRAKTVYDYLVDKGIAKERMSYNGFGNKRQLVPEINAENEAKNRRVEIRVMKR
jgi:outer membrane protein OmpA-like peptidoglycan-associated protein